MEQLFKKRLLPERKITEVIYMPAVRMKLMDPTKSK